ncbi:MAG: hypothetical protein K0R94_89 [Burkholderiales bacterium]|jgi:hypothetical protein|nr:hypothetical protein [Burkholderiales bacterium]
MKYKLNKLRWVAVNLVLSTTACTTGNNVGGNSTNSLNTTNNNYLNAASTQVEKQGEIPGDVGYAFDDRTGMSKAVNCLVNAGDPSAIVLSTPKLTLDFTNTVSAADIGVLFNEGISGNADFGLFSISPAAIYTRARMLNQRTIDFNYVQTLSADATFTVKGTGSSILSADAQNILAQGNDAFTQVCGNSIILSSKKGAVLEATLTIKFANAAKKRQFEQETAGSISGIESIVSAFKKSEQTSTRGAFIGISIYQLGGDPTKTHEIFNGLVCDVDNLDSCQQIVKNLINYANNDFQTGVNFKDPSTLYTYKFKSKQYSELGLKVTLDPLTADEQAAKNYLTTSVIKDRQMLAYLNTYVKQVFFNTYVDYVTQSNVFKAITDYSSIIDYYDDIRNSTVIIDSCYDDTNNINTKCILAAKQIKIMRSKFQASIALANNLATVMDMNSPIGEIVFIPVNVVDSSVGNILNNVTGIYVAYLPKIQALSSECNIDSSTDYEYFKTYFPQYGSKSLYCVDDPSIVPGVTNFFVNGFGNRNYQGIAGHMVNSVETLYPAGPDGNIQYSYSDSSDFKYNPI